MSKEYLLQVQKTLATRFDGEAAEVRGDPRLIVTSAQIVEVATALREEFGFEYLSDITVVDYWPQDDPRFHVVYQFSSLKNNCRLEVRVPLSGDEPTLPSISNVYWSACWPERELYDMFGVEMQNHPDLRRILMPHDWQGHPLRKDYPLGYEEVQFSFNFGEVAQRKPHPEE